MNVRLVLERKRKRVWTTQLRGTEATLGRGQGSTIRIPASDVSRLHCRLRIDNDIVTVEDLESVNGTLLNGERVQSVEIVRPGDRLTIGSVTLLVEYELTPDALERLGDGAEAILLETDDEDEVIEIVEESAPAPPPVRESIPVVEVVEEVVEEEVFVLDADDEINLPQGGDLREFLLELDDTDEKPKKRK
jgi:pSer/pThr/pTyr-binding forkhead associated (FHA) protein